MDEQSLRKKLLALSESDFNNYQSLPFAVYVTYKDGVILNLNEEAKTLLSISDEDKCNINIKQFYRQIKERSALIEKLAGKPSGEWEKNQTLSFQVNGKMISLRFFAKTYKDEDGVFIGSLCLVFQITAFERFRYLEDDMNVGFFELSENNIISYSNNKFNEILGIANNDEINNFENFVPVESRGPFSGALEKLRNGKEIKNELFDLTKKDKTPLVGKVRMIVDDLDEEKNVIKIKGTLEDATFSDILEDLPIGLFSLMETNKRPLFIGHCNNHFAEIFGLEIKSCIGKEFRRLIDNINDFPELEQAIKQLKEDERIPSYVIKCGMNPPKELIIHIKRLKNRNHTFRYTGVIYDVTDDVATRLADWKQDFASFLHSYSAMSNSIRDTLSSIIETHGTDVVKENKTDVDKAFQEVRNHINAFKTHYQKYLMIATERGFDGSEIANHLSKLAELENFDKANSNTKELSKLSLAGIRNIFLRIRKSIENQPAPVSKELSRGVNNEIGEIFRYIKLLNLYYIEQDAFIMGLDIEEFKDVLRSGTYKAGDDIVNLFDAVSDVALSLNEFADRKNVEFKVRNFVNKALIKCDQRALYLAFYNVLMNAVKYSWAKPGERKSWITIELSNIDSWFIIKIENRGVGIHRSEIDSGKIFEFGHRGSQSSDRNRPGTGIGLWHTKKIVSRLNGSVNIISEPIAFNSPDNFKRPFLTKVTIKLPKTHE